MFSVLSACECDLTSCWSLCSLDFATVIDYSLELWAKIYPFSQVAFCEAFYYSNECETVLTWSQTGDHKVASTPLLHINLCLSETVCPYINLYWLEPPQPALLFVCLFLKTWSRVVSLHPLMTSKHSITEPCPALSSILSCGSWSLRVALAGFLFHTEGPWAGHAAEVSTYFLVYLWH